MGTIGLLFAKGDINENHTGSTHMQLLGRGL
jgi:hypothetical protein